MLTFPQLMTTAAAVMLFGMALWWPFRDAGQPDLPEATPAPAVMMVETDLKDATPVVYIDQPSGWTVVWVLEAETTSPAG